VLALEAVVWAVHHIAGKAKIAATTRGLEMLMGNFAFLQRRMGPVLTPFPYRTSIANGTYMQQVE